MPPSSSTIAWPPIPKSISAPLGPVSVALVAEVPAIDETKAEESGTTMMGRWSPVDRRIRLRRDMLPETLWATLFHEQVHAFIDDTGHIFSDDDKERICDLVALGRMGELRDRLSKPR